MRTKIIKIGNSTGVIIPKKLLEEIGLKLRSNVVIEKDAANNALVIADKPRKKSSVTPEFLDLLDEINEKYDNAWKELAKR